MTPSITLEHLLRSEAGFALTTASPLQVAIARAADGLGLADVLDEENCQKHFGCSAAELGQVLPTLVVIVAGVRGGKSLMAAAGALKAALTADLSQLMHHEIARVAIIAPTVDNSVATFRLLVGAMQSSAHLQGLLVDEPKNETVMVRRSDGRVVEIVVVAAHKGAVTVRSRWLCAALLDEVALFGIEATGAAVNAEELLRAAETRLVKGGQVWLISSPYGPQGLLHQLWKDHFGKPGRVLVAHAPTLAMNTAFDPEQVEAIRKRDPDAAAREYDASWIDADTALLSSVHVDAAMRKEPAELPREPHHHYVCALDPAFRGNGFTLVILTKKTEPIEEQSVLTANETEALVKAGVPGPPMRVRTVVVVARQWIGSKAAPLSPSTVFAEIAALCSTYGISTVASDQFSIDALRDIARQFGLVLFSQPMTAQLKLALFERMRTELAERTLELPPDPVMRSDLLAVRKKVGASGVTIDLPHTANGRHSDYAPALALALGQYVSEPTPPKIGPKPGSPEWCRLEQQHQKELAMRVATRRDKRTWRQQLAALERRG